MGIVTPEKLKHQNRSMDSSCHWPNLSDWRKKGKQVFWIKSDKNSLLNKNILDGLMCTVTPEKLKRQALLRPVVVAELTEWLKEGREASGRGLRAPRPPWLPRLPCAVRPPRRPPVVKGDLRQTGKSITLLPACPGLVYLFAKPSLKIGSVNKAFLFWYWQLL